jgi:dynein heavy chain
VSKPEGPDVLMGEVHENTHNVMNTVVASVYSRFIDKLGPEEWGHCESEAKKEFQLLFSKFQEEMREAVKSLQQNLNLTPYEPKYQDMATNFITKGVTAKDHQSMVNHFEQVFTSWYETIEKNLDDGDDQKKDDKDSGPRIELDYWKNKMRKLTSISEQLKSKNCRTVYDVLNMVSSGTASDAGKPKEKIYLATSKWRSIELKVTEQLNEAKDNVKYLQTLEKFIEPLYEGDPAAIIETLPALMNSIKMIHTIARYYNTNERMTGLFVKITNMMIHNSKYNIMNFMRIRKGEKPLGVMGGLSSKDPRSKGVPLQDTDLWKEKDYPHDKLIEMFATVEELLKQYKLNYEKTRDRLKEMPKAKQFDFSEQAIFNKFELFCRRVGKLKELFKTISQFNELEKHNLENIEPIVKKFNQTVETFKKKNHMLLDYMNGLFDKDYVEFNVEVSHVEIDLREYINHNFDHVSNIEDSLKLLRKFRYILKRPMLVKCLYEKYDVLLHTYKKNLDKIEKNYADQ